MSLFKKELKPSDDAQVIADGLHDLAAAVREMTAAMAEPAQEPSPEKPATYMDGTPVDA